MSSQLVYDSAADQRREALAALVAALVMAGLYGLAHLAPLPHFHQEKQAIAIELQPAPPEPQPAPPIPQAQAPAPVAQPQPVLRQAVSKPQPAPSPIPQPSAVPAAPSRTVTTPSPVPSPVRAAEPAPKANVSADREFEAKVRAYIERQKSYPTGREVAIEKPEGTVHACVELGRDGGVRNVSVQQGSGFASLDKAAQRLLNTISYPAFPEGTFSGDTSHVFCTRLKYEPPTN
ncbi:hypothetical protein THUN1379_09280 [Paludibacterium sp. THUN1379]|uniref:energy transducer TonB n=1 Tax=Paludibacterium sp. THUN1379 TaxID=3112107 RepID=UPI003089C2A1|nr:hypothetical protein THUN1379_09280 [Paludibacterium sp. THUN1379]